MQPNLGSYEYFSLIVEVRHVSGRIGTCRTWFTPTTRHVDNPMAKAIARAFRWREMLENGKYATISEIATSEQINESYVGRVLRLTLLAPEIVDSLLSGRQLKLWSSPARRSQMRYMEALFGGLPDASARKRPRRPGAIS
jgi:hypothetical protein